MRRFGEYLGLLEDTGSYDEFDGADYQTGQYPAVQDGDQARTAHQPAQQYATAASGATATVARTTPAAPAPAAHVAAAPAATPRRGEAAPVADLADRRRPLVAAPAPAPVAETDFSRIVSLTPRTYNEARVVGENFREGLPVIMNLSEMDDSDAKRLVDFAAGLVFATRGNIERITAKVFLLSPPNVSVNAEEKLRLAENGFFNQS